ncbi:MAG: alpha/beta hydrolase [Acidimicrobiales bacterium]|nr:alpha/beta hydrolase [Acidimicrobiales bacterium]
MEYYDSFPRQKEVGVKIPIPRSSLEINGVLRGDYSHSLAILAPGLGGWMHDLILFNASRFFDEQNIATLRVSFYGDGDKQRNIGDFDVKTNAADIDTIVNYAKQKGSDWVCVIGHSYSGMAIVYSKKQAFDAAVLWDASHTDGYNEPQAKQNLDKDFSYIPELDSYVSARGPGYVLSRKVFENYAPGSNAMARNFKIPTLVINASQSGNVMRQFGEDYANSIDAETKHVAIPGASHPFTEDGAMEQLYKVTTDWIKSQSNKR